jgi:hypothetical protein
MERDPATFLPPHIRDVLKRKSSRDPTSRFPKKLHLLLSYVYDLPLLEDQIGLSWLSDDEFKMNKSKLADVMGIKLNTLNVNLRDLHFNQTQRDKDGWTHWKKPGFTRSSNGLDGDDAPIRSSAPFAADFLSRAPFVLGKLNDSQRDQFLTESRQLWNAIFQCSPTLAVPTEIAIEKAAARFRYNEQPLQNAKEVIDAIIRPNSNEKKLLFPDFCRFLAMFGPEKTIMLKIAALLTCSNASGKWLSFERDHTRSRPPIAFFDFEMPNCLIVNHADGSKQRVFNNPIAEAGGQEYLMNEEGKSYRDWDDWFGKNPVKQQSGFGMFQFQ